MGIGELEVNGETELEYEPEEWNCAHSGAVIIILGFYSSLAWAYLDVLQTICIRRFKGIRIWKYI